MTPRGMQVSHLWGAAAYAAAPTFAAPPKGRGANRDIVACDTLSIAPHQLALRPQQGDQRPPGAGAQSGCGGRPKRTPRALARVRPSPVRARISSRSNSARPPKTVSINRPCAVVVSAHVSCRDLKPAPASAMAANVLSESLVDLANRSACHHEHVAGREPLQRFGQFGTIRFGARYLFGEDLGAASGM